MACKLLEVWITEIYGKLAQINCHMSQNLHKSQSQISQPTRNSKWLLPQWHHSMNNKISLKTHQIQLDFLVTTKYAKIVHNVLSLCHFKSWFKNKAIDSYDSLFEAHHRSHCFFLPSQCSMLRGSIKIYCEDDNDHALIYMVFNHLCGSSWTSN